MDYRFYLEFVAGARTELRSRKEKKKEGIEAFTRARGWPFRENSFVSEETFEEIKKEIQASCPEGNH